MRLPFFEYHHIVPYSVEAHFRVEDTMLLCPNCHSMATAGALSIEEQRKFKAKPYNVKRNFAAGLLAFSNVAPAVSLGGNVFVNDGTILSFSERSVLSLGVNEGALSVSMVVDDEDGNTLAIVENNEWVSGDSRVWDLDARYKRLTLKTTNRKVALEIDGRKWPIAIKAHLWEAGRRIFVGPRGLAFGARDVWWNGTTSRLRECTSLSTISRRRKRHVPLGFEWCRIPGSERGNTGLVQTPRSSLRLPSG